ncbi:hypothetical protein ACFQGX_12810 [Nonomuraea dietziae]|uniref:hypothetical protein n=1 Tax=Nonomuraea dietziae TaxID=65515 RepID=UPI00361A3474
MHDIENHDEEKRKDRRSVPDAKPQQGSNQQQSVKSERVPITFKPWANNSNIRLLIAELERAARAAEKFALPRAPRWDALTRQEAYILGLKLATVIRSYKPRLIHAQTPKDFEPYQNPLHQVLPHGPKGT